MDRGAREGFRTPDKQRAGCPASGRYRQRAYYRTKCKNDHFTEVQKYRKRAGGSGLQVSAPEESAVCGFRIKKDGKILTGVMEEREEAFKKYDEALEQGNRGYLIDQERPNIFTLSVGNIEPQGQLAIEIDYITQLDANGSEVRFIVPTTIAPRYVPGGVTEPGGMPTSEAVNPPVKAYVDYGLSIRLSIDGTPGIAELKAPRIRFAMETETTPPQWSSPPIPCRWTAILS